jgi:hypothetical protein
MAAFTEAYLPLIYAKELGQAPQLVLALVPAEGASVDMLQRSVTSRLADCQWTSDELGTLVATDPALLQTLRGAGVQVWPVLSDEWSTRVGKRTGASWHIWVAIIVSLLLLLGWTLLSS